jgi:lipopolysaccharide/colanic/teichoic acid biosynthesis glycosyltransferase
MIIRLLDIIFSIIAIIILLPIFIIISLFIGFGSKGGVFFKQTRVGKNNIDFKLLKFRTMYIGSDNKGLLTIGEKDNRITNTGLILRKYKLDELPQIWNILIGDMSFVGPRPEVRKYVNLYNQNQKRVLEVKPGLTDIASLEFFDENRLLAEASNPEQFYIDEIMPKKIELNRFYIENKSLKLYLSIIFRTFIKTINY